MDGKELPSLVNSDVVKRHMHNTWGQFKESLFGPPKGLIRIFKFRLSL